MRPCQFLPAPQGRQPEGLGGLDEQVIDCFAAPPPRWLPAATAEPLRV